MANRGAASESIIEVSNTQYMHKGWAIIKKVATPMTPRRVGGQIVGAFYREKSTVDYVGMAQGRPVAFDVKSTENKTSFPLKNIKEHQMWYLREWAKQGGLSFFLVDFIGINKLFYIPFDSVLYYWNRAKEGGRKSITLADFEENAILIKTNSRGILVDYLLPLGVGL